MNVISIHKAGGAAEENEVVHAVVLRLVDLFQNRLSPIAVFRIDFGNFSLILYDVLLIFIFYQENPGHIMHMDIWANVYTKPITSEIDLNGLSISEYFK